MQAGRVKMQGWQKQKHEREDGDKRRLCLTESLQSWSANEVWPTATNSEVCVPPPRYKHNVTTSSTHLSVCDAPAASVSPVPHSLMAELAHPQCRLGSACWGFLQWAPGSPVPPYPTFLLLAGSHPVSSGGDVTKCRSVALLRWHYSQWLIWMLLRSWLR